MSDDELEFRDGYCLCKEGIHFEAKEARSGLPKNVWETYSSFANTDGGTIVFGLAEDGTGLRVSGVSDAEGMVRNIWNIINNKEKVSCNLLVDRDVRIVDAEGHRLVVMDVPRARRGDRPVFLDGNPRNSFRRNGEGDFKCSPEDVASMVADSVPGAIDRWPVRSSEIRDLSSDTIRAFRNSMRTLRPEHPWNTVDDAEFLRLVGASVVDDGEVRPTFAGLLMFGMEYCISLESYGYRLDYRAYADGGEEWTDRIVSGTGDWSGNLYDFYRHVVNRMKVATGRGMAIGRDLKRVEDTELDKCMREMVLNALVNADYRGRGGVVVEWTPGTLSVGNPGTFRIPIEIAEEGGISDPRNQTVAKMFSLIGDVERAGSGVRRIMTACRRMGLYGPVIRELFDPVRVNVTIGLTPAGSSSDAKSLEDAVWRMMESDDSISISKIADALGIGRSRVERAVESLKSDGRIERSGGTRGRWIVKGSIDDKGAFSESSIGTLRMI